MKKAIKSILTIVFIAMSLTACRQKATEGGHSEAESENAAHEETVNLESRQLHLSDTEFNALQLKADSIPLKALSGYVDANGKLEVPPQNEAAVTAVVGANVTSIRVMEGNKVSKGTILAYLSHPDLIKVQSDYTNAYNYMQFLEKDYQRQKRLYEVQVASGRTFQEAETAYNGAKARVKALESQLLLLHLNLLQIRSGHLYSEVPVLSPIDGYVESVNIKVGQYVQQQTEMFEIVNTAHIHADLMVFEKDAGKVKEGQTMELRVASMPETAFNATIYSVGKTFEKDPKAVHIHAELENRQEGLFPGMYITGKIITSENKVPALPEEAIIMEEGASYIFKAKQIEQEWIISPVKVDTGIENSSWIEIKNPPALQKDEKIIWNKAYYLISEMQKGETGHDD